MEDEPVINPDKFRRRHALAQVLNGPCVYLMSPMMYCKMLAWPAVDVDYTDLIEVNEIMMVGKVGPHRMILSPMQDADKIFKMQLAGSALPVIDDLAKIQGQPLKITEVTLEEVRIALRLWIRDQRSNLRCKLDEAKAKDVIEEDVDSVLNTPAYAENLEASEEGDKEEEGDTP